MTSARPSPLTWLPATNTPPVNPGVNAKKLWTSPPVAPSNTLTCGPPPGPAPATTSGVPSPLTSPTATRTPPGKPAFEGQDPVPVRRRRRLEHPHLRPPPAPAPVTRNRSTDFQSPNRFTPSPAVKYRVSRPPATHRRGRRARGHGLLPYPRASPSVCQSCGTAPNGGASNVSTEMKNVRAPTPVKAVPPPISFSFTVPAAVPSVLHGWMPPGATRAKNACSPETPNGGRRRTPRTLGHWKDAIGAVPAGVPSLRQTSQSSARNSSNPLDRTQTTTHGRPPWGPASRAGGWDEPIITRQAGAPQAGQPAGGAPGAVRGRWRPPGPRTRAPRGGAGGARRDSRGRPGR